jgi:hypothetical protein
MFMDATGSHRSNVDRAKIRRHMARGKLAEVTASAGSENARFGLSDNLDENTSGSPDRSGPASGTLDSGVPGQP